MNKEKNGICYLQEYEIDGRKWIIQNDLEKDWLWISQWSCDDGDGAELYIQKDNGGFELKCFSGIPASYIFIDIVDFGTMWYKAFNDSVEKIQPFSEYSYIQQCIMLADWLCSIFCRWIDVSNYEEY